MLRITHRFATQIDFLNLLQPKACKQSSTATVSKSAFSADYGLSGSRRRRKSSSWDRSRQPVQVLHLSVLL